MHSLEPEERRMRADDGTEIAYLSVGRGAPVLVANGLGGDWRAWAPQLEYFQDRYQFLVWDYRGLFGSGPPASDSGLGAPVHARDALALLQHESVERAAVVGWSVGVQVALELFRQAPERVTSLVLVNGLPHAPWARRRRWIGGALKPTARLARRAPKLAERALRMLLTSPESIGWAKRAGWVCRAIDDDTLVELADALVRIDPAVYLRMLRAMEDHDATDVLSTIDVPTLIIAGERDPFTPRDSLARMAEDIAGAEVLTLPAAGHFIGLGFPEHVSLRIEKFFRERGYGGV